jgi:threonine/homoserine/homoserine lactone efflux protein
MGLNMRIFLFTLSIVSLLLAAHQFSLTKQTGQFKGALFLLLIGIQLLIAAALISQHREERTRRSKGIEPTAVGVSGEQGKSSQAQ